MFGRMKKIINNILKEFGYKLVKNNDTNGQRVPFAQMIYSPRWRLKNYYALKEFGEEIKRWFIEQKYYYFIGEFPNLDKPRTFNEKIHWLNLNYYDERITTCCDKVRMKQYVSSIVGEQYVVPIVKTYSRASDINLEELPDKFAIKVNWGDGAEFSEIIFDKNCADVNRIKSKMNNAMQPWNNLYYSHFFIGYRDVKPLIFVEKFLESKDGDLRDYKIHCFNGKPEIILVCEDRFQNRMKKTFLNVQWEVLECHREDADIDYDVKKPVLLEEMLDVASKLAEPFPFVRVDFYIVNNRIYVGEMTFHPGCGFEKFEPDIWNVKMGDYLKLPNMN